MAAGVRVDPTYDFDTGPVVDELGDHVVTRIVDAIVAGEVSREVEG